MINTSLYIMIILLARKYIKNAKLKVFITVLSFSLIVLIGFSRVYLGVHYAGDILGGWLIGFALSLGIYCLIYVKK